MTDAGNIPQLPHVASNPTSNGLIGSPLGGFSPQASAIPGITHDSVLGKYHNDINERNKKMAEYLVAQKAGASAEQLQHIIDDILHADNAAQDLYQHHMTRQQKDQATIEDRRLGQSITPATDANDAQDVREDLNALPGAHTPAKGEKQEPPVPETQLGANRHLLSNIGNLKNPGTDWTLYLSLVAAFGRHFTGSHLGYEFSGDQQGQAQAPNIYAASLLARGASDGQAMSATYHHYYNSRQADDFDVAYHRAITSGQSDREATNYALDIVAVRADARIRQRTDQFVQQGQSHEDAYIHAFAEESVNSRYRPEFERMVQAARARGRSVEEAVENASTQLSEAHADAHHVHSESVLDTTTQHAVRTRYLNDIAAGMSPYDAQEDVLQHMGDQSQDTRDAAEAYMIRLLLAAVEASEGTSPGHEFARVIPPLSNTQHEALSTAYQNGIHRGLSPTAASQAAMAVMRGQGDGARAAAQLFLLSLQPDPSSSGGSDGEFKH